MKELLEYREKLIIRLEEAAREFCKVCESFDDPFTKVDGDWTVHQIAGHTRDVDLHVYGMRIRRTLNEEYPRFASFDADQWMASEYKRDEPLKTILDGFLASMVEVCELLNRLPQEGWSRLSRHESLGNELTLQLWAERSLAHIEEHLKTLKKG